MSGIGVVVATHLPKGSKPATFKQQTARGTEQANGVTGTRTLLLPVQNLFEIVHLRITDILLGSLVIGRSKIIHDVVNI